MKEVSVDELNKSEIYLTYQNLKDYVYISITKLIEIKENYIKFEDMTTYISMYKRLFDVEISELSDTFDVDYGDYSKKLEIFRLNQNEIYNHVLMENI